MTRNNTFGQLRERERAARRQIIINAAERVFGSKPFRQVSMRDIAREAGISPASIYRYFPDQQTLFLEAYLLGADRLVSMIRDAVNGSGFSLESVATVYISFLLENDHYFRMMTQFGLDGVLPGFMMDRLLEMERFLLDELDRLFVRLGAAGDPRSLSHAFFAALNGVLITFRHSPGRLPDEATRHIHRVAGNISRVFSDGLDRK